MIEHRYRHCVVAVLVPDRPGIIRDVTAAITDLNGNINDIRQTVVDCYFTMALTATFDAPLSEREIGDAIRRNARGDDTTIIVKEWKPPAASRARHPGNPYVIAVTGPDRKGILKCVTTYLAAHNINIEDWECQLEASTVNYVGDITVPNELDIKKLQDGLRAELTGFNMQCNILHKNIFLATNDIGPIRSLLRG